VLAAERHQRILANIHHHGVVKTKELASALKVSVMTVRRDLAALEHQGLLQRTHGGATEPRSRDQSYGLRERVNRLQKERLGLAAAQLVKAGESVFIDAGTTCIEVARHLRKRRLSSLSIVTASIKVSSELSGLDRIRVVQLGGELYGQSYGVVGSSANDTLSQMRLDWAFVGAVGVDPSIGLTNNNEIEVPLKRIALKVARRAVILVDSSKIGRAGLALISPISQPYTLLTTAALSPDTLAAFRHYGWEVIAPA
jgi:DeoR/GlpR family transcriptional regulator of sugar metabolism